MATLADLDKLIPQYALNKSKLEGYKKICDKENAEIKAIMKSFVVSKYETDDYRATYSTVKKETMNEDVLISLFNTVPAFTEIADTFGIVKIKPYIDFDALENALYHNALTPEQIMELDKAKEVKEVVTLRVTKKKKQEDDE